MKRNMKLKPILILLLVFLSALVLPAEDKGYVIFRGTFFLPADANFKDFYGSSAIMPGIGFAMKLRRSLSLFVSADYLAKTGSTMGALQDPTKTSQIFVACGLEVRLGLTPKHDAALRAGAAYIHFRDTAFSETFKGNRVGFLFGAGLKWKMKSFFLALDIDYLRATAIPFTEKIILGGMKVAVGIGRFF